MWRGILIVVSAPFGYMIKFNHYVSQSLSLHLYRTLDKLITVREIFKLPFDTCSLHNVTSKTATKIMSIEGRFFPPLKH